jgi:dihydrolipoamide dehydrogenase
VSVVEMLDGLLPGADRDLVKPLAKRVAKLFENVWIKTRVAAMRAGDDGVEVSFEGEAALSPQRFRRVLVAVGRRPNSAHLGLEKTKVTVDQRGFVVVDHQCRTAEPHIFAIGDVAGEPMLAHKATHEGKTAVEVLAGEPAAFAPRAIPAVVFTDPEIAWAGLTETAAKREDQSYQVVQFPWAASGRAQAVGRNEGLTKWLVEPASERLLGCGIVGQGAGDLIGEAALAIELGCVARDVAETIHPHPTFCETLAFAAETFYGTATDIYRPKREK